MKRSLIHERNRIPGPGGAVCPPGLEATERALGFKVSVVSVGKTLEWLPGLDSN